MERISKPDAEFRPIIKSGGKKGYVPVMDNENFVHNVLERKSKHGQKILQYTILLLCLIILGLLGYLTYTGQIRNPKMDHDQEVKEKLMEELIKDLLDADTDKTTENSDIERYGRSLGSNNNGWRVDTYTNGNNGLSTHGQNNGQTMDGWRVDTYTNGNNGLSDGNGAVSSQGHCLRSNVRTRCAEGPGRRVYNTGQTNVWNPAFTVDIGEDPNWNCHYCCLDEGKSLQVCPQGTDNGVSHNTVHSSNQEYYNGWTVESYQNGVRVLSEPDPSGMDMYLTLSVCGSHNSGTNDLASLEFRYANGDICRTSEEFNRDGSLNSDGSTKTYHWSTMGNCAHLEQYNSNLEFRLLTRTQSYSRQSDELKVCQLTLSTRGSAYRWEGETSCEGTGEWQTLNKDRKCVTSGKHFRGSPLKVFKNGQSNSQGNVFSVEDCMRLCKRYASCSWFNWYGSNGPSPWLRNRCWLKTAKGTEHMDQAGFTGPRGSSVACT